MCLIALDNIMTSREAIIALVSSILSGLAVWIVQQVYLNRREKRKEVALTVVKSPNESKSVPGKILYTLGPGRSVALMRDMLGVPDIMRRLDFPIFSEDEVNTHSYLYHFKNARLKITSKDNESIDSITIAEADNSVDVDVLLLSDCGGSTKFGEFKVWPELVEGVMNHRHVTTIKDSFFALEELTGPPLHHHYTFFGYSDKSLEYDKTQDPKVFLGEKIRGVCVSASSEDVYFVYFSELL